MHAHISRPILKRLSKRRRSFKLDREWPRVSLHPILHLWRRPLAIHRACEVTWRRFSDRTAEYITQEYKVHGYWLFTADGKCKTGAKVCRKQIHTLTRGPPQRDTCTLVTYNRVNVIQDMWASAHLVFGTWAPQQTASLRLGSECRSPAGRWLGLAPARHPWEHQH